MRWYHAFQTYLLAAGIDALPVPRKLALLEHCLGTEGQCILSTIDIQHPAEGQARYQQVVDALDAHFGSRVTVITERHRFRQRIQASGESIKQFVSALRQLATKCQFAELHDQMLRDQLIEKTSSPAIRERLLQEKDDLTFSQAVTLACQVEAAKSEAKQITGGNVSAGSTSTPDVQRVSSKPQRTPRSQTVTSQSTSQSSSFCANCGLSGHKASSQSCPAKGKECFRCHKKNHYGRCCRSTPKPSSQGGPKGAAVRSVVNTISVCARTGFKLCTLVVAHHSLDFIIDLGANVSIMNEATWRRLFSSFALQPTSTQLTGYDSKRIEALGTVSLPVRYDDQVVSQFQFFVTVQGTNLMGGSF